MINNTMNDNSIFESTAIRYNKEWMQDRIDQLEWDLKMMYKMKPDAAIRHLRKKIGYDEFLRDYAKEKNIPYQDLVDVAKELEESASKYESLEKWLTHVEKYSEELKQKDKSRMENSKGINLMTIHGAKGLEFDTVYIVEANEGQMPYKKSLKEGGLEEERRLFYVAMTRAKNTLKIVYTKKNVVGMVLKFEIQPFGTTIFNCA